MNRRPSKTQRKRNQQNAAWARGLLAKTGFRQQHQMNKTIAAQLERIDRQLNRIYADRINALTEIDGLRKRRHPDLAQKLADFAEQKKEMDRLHDRMNRLKTLQGQINDRNKHRGLL